MCEVRLLSLRDELGESGQSLHCHMVEYLSAAPPLSSRSAQGGAHHQNSSRQQIGSRRGSIENTTFTPAFRRATESSDDSSASMGQLARAVENGQRRPMMGSSPFRLIIELGGIGAAVLWNVHMHITLSGHAQQTQGADFGSGHPGLVFGRARSSSRQERHGRAAGPASDLASRSAP